jgi:hypothetical protein
MTDTPKPKDAGLDAEDYLQQFPNAEMFDTADHEPIEGWVETGAPRPAPLPPIDIRAFIRGMKYGSS